MCYGTAMLIHNPDSGLQAALVIQTFYVLLYSISSTSSDAMLIRQNLSCCLERKDSIGMLLDHFVTLLFACWLKYSQNSLQVEGVAVYLLVENRDY
jgi:hypothetical protein